MERKFFSILAPSSNGVTIVLTTNTDCLLNLMGALNKNWDRSGSIETK